MASIVKVLKSLSGRSQALGWESFPLDPRLADMMAKTFPVPVVVIDRAQDRIHWVSPGFIEMSKADPTYLRNSSARAVLERYFSPAQLLLELFDRRTPQAELEATLQSEDGNSYNILGVWMGMQLDPHSPTSLYLLIFQDVSEEKRLKAELEMYAEELKQQIDELKAVQESREKLLSEVKAQAEHLRLLASVVAHTHEMAIILDAQGQILWTNRTFEKRFGYSREQLVGKLIEKVRGMPCYFLPNPQHTSNGFSITQRFSNHSIEEEAYCPNWEGKGFWAHITIIPVLDEVGDAKHYTVILRDITTRKEREEALAQRNAELESSLHYAARLQKAFLPFTLEKLKNYFKDVSIWYQPLGSLGGDFYGYLPVEDGVVVGLGDATGHGIPAALMSVYAITSLYEKVRQNGLNVQKIYEGLIESIHSFFGDKENLSEGFELGLVGYQPSSQKAYYIGARRPLWLYRHGEIYVVEGGKIDVSAHTRSEAWAKASIPTAQSLMLEPGDRLYLFSDGLVDQLGGPDRKRFSRTRLSSFLRTNSYLPLSELTALLQEALRTFAGDEPQTDDIVFLALEV